MEADDGALPEAALEADRTGDLRGTEPADLDVDADADAEIASLLARLRLFLPQPGIVDVRERLVECALVVAAVVLQAGNDIMAVVERRNEVALADVRGIDLELVGEPIDHALQHERRFGPTGAPICLYRR